VSELTVSTEALAGVEAMCAVTLPASFPKFLERYQGAKPVDGEFDITSTGDTHYLEQFLVCVDRTSHPKFFWADIGVVYSQADERLTFEDAAGDLIVFVPFAALFTGDLLVLDYRESDTEPRVGVWFHERSRPYVPYVEDVAESFDAFLNQIEIDLDSNN